MVVSSFDFEANLAACAEGDHVALQKLYKQESPHMLALFTKLLSQRSHAEEIVRDVVVLVWENAANYDRDSGPARAWIYSILRYRALNRLRQTGRGMPADTDWVDTLPDGAGVQPDADPSATARTLAGMDDARRRPILMAFYNGFTYE